MKMDKLTIMLSSLILLSVFPCDLIAGNDPETEIFSLESGDYKIDINIKYNYTIRRICFEHYELGTNTGFYGTVTAPDSGKYIGAGHTEGGIEQIQKVTLYVDNNATGIENAKTYNGKVLKFEKISRFDNLIFTTTLEVSPSGIVERKSFEALEDQKMNLLYAFLYCFNV
jgi:hypothetical protein